MEYKKKLIFLFSLIAVLAVTYTASLVFDPQFSGTRSAAYVWLDSRFAGRIAGIEITSQDETTELVKRNNQWFVLHNEREYPARQLRVEDFIGIFTTRAAWPVRSSSAASHERLGVGAEPVSRVRFYGETSTLLDVLLGSDDITGREIYLRRHAQNEVRSGDNLFSVYVRGGANGWYNLRLIPESEDGRLGIDNVQRLTVLNLNEAQTFNKRNRQWVFTGGEPPYETRSAEETDQSTIDNYVRTILNMEGDDFTDFDEVDLNMITHSNIVIEFGNGSVRSVWFSGPDETGRRLARVDGVDYIYSIAPWAVQRIFRNDRDFERQ